MARPLDRHPRHRGHGRRDVRDRHRHPGHTVSGQLTPRVEAEPPHPEHRRADHCQDQAVGRHRGLGVATTRAQNDTQHESSDTGVDMHDGAAGKVQDAKAAKPAAAPHPVGHRCVDHRQPDGHEPEHRRELHPLGERPNHQRRRDDRERQLKHLEDTLWDRPAQAVDAHVHQQYMAQSDERVESATVAEGQTVRVQRPQNRDHAGNRKTLHHDGEHVLRPDESGIKQRQPRNRHKQDQHARRQHPCRVA